ncbi:hypothetical protein [Pseudorhodoferax sp. Leaf267]|uniref:hypothetical protein n=1 Tax=Pseudorhodoferax sp. Leaf267 TaxID=1736316 RepID=UPI0012E12D01|nr:hypothetical protein [Pseudorhodoferax sp. Leaf267]
MIVVGTAFGDRERMTRAFARKGAEVQLRRAMGSRDPQAIAVWVRCSRFFGLWKTWAHIGFVALDPSDPWAPKLDSGAMRVVRAWVHSTYVPLEREMPKVSVRVIVDSDAPDTLHKPGL